MKADVGVIVFISLLLLILIPSISLVIGESDNVEVNQIGYRGR